MSLRYILSSLVLDSLNTMFPKALHILRHIFPRPYEAFHPGQGKVIRKGR